MEHIFISYVNENIKDVQRLYKMLKSEGFNVWLDKDQISPGERWKDVIRKAIRDGAFFISCFSKEYYSKDRTYMNEELTLAIEELRLRSPDRTWFIPVLLSECEVPNRYIGAGDTLRSLQYVKLHENWNDGVARILLSIKKASHMGEDTANESSKADTFLEVEYSSDYSPPAPIINIIVCSNLTSSKEKNINNPTVKVPMLIDTGADISMIPKKMVNELEEKLGMKLPCDYIEVEDFSGTRFVNKTYQLEFRIKSDFLDFHSMNFVEIDDDQGILGRDILNNYSLMIEGQKIKIIKKKKDFRKDSRRNFKDFNFLMLGLRNLRSKVTPKSRKVKKIDSDEPYDNIRNTRSDESIFFINKFVIISTWFIVIASIISLIAIIFFALIGKAAPSIFSYLLLVMIGYLGGVIASYMRFVTPSKKK